MDYYSKYLKYKNKYLTLKDQQGGCLNESLKLELTGPKTDRACFFDLDNTLTLKLQDTEFIKADQLDQLEEIINDRSYMNQSEILGGIKIISPIYNYLRFSLIRSLYENPAFLYHFFVYL